MPRSSQKRSASSIASCTSGLRKLRSGWCWKKRCQKYWPRTGSHVQLEGSESRKMIRASCQGSSESDQTYQSPCGPFASAREDWNHAWSLDVWFITKSVITRMPRRWAASTSARKSSVFP